MASEQLSAAEYGRSKAEGDGAAAWEARMCRNQKSVGNLRVRVLNYERR